MSTTAEIAALEAPAIRRALRHLQCSGRRLIQRRKDWAVVGAANTLVFATLRQEDVALLAAEKLIVAADGGGHVAAQVVVVVAKVDVVDEGRTPEIIPRTGPWVFDVVSYTQRKKTGLGFASLASRAQAGEGPLTLRQAVAGLRFIADVEQTQRGERITMDWSGLMADRQRRRGRDGGPARAARRANLRLLRLRAELGEGAFALVRSACIDRASVRALARERGIRSKELQRRLSVALEKLAAAYDGVAAEAEA